VTELLDRVQGALGDAFRVESELPAGGMSRIFLATEASLNRRVVVKVLPPEMTSEVSAARFRQEVELLARLQHPHILPILATGSRGDLLYYVMPYVSGESLRHRLVREGALPVEEATRILAEVADALSYAHAAGVLHRDIKPENILLEGRHAVLADFGVARAIQEATAGGKLTATGAAVGTPGYMSPEQVAGDHVDLRADVYALGVVGYEMFAGKPPFEGPSAQAVLAAHLTTPPLPLREVRPEVPVQVSQAIACALAKEASQRFRNAGEFAEALSAHPPSEAAAAANSSPRRVGAMVAVAALLAVVGYLAWRSGNRVDPAVLARVRLAADSSRLDEVARLVDSAGISLSAGALAPVFAEIGGHLSATSAPSGASVEAARISPIDGFDEARYRPLGTTPLSDAPLVAGEYSIRFSLPGHDTYLALGAVVPGVTVAVAAGLSPADSTRGPMVRVPGGLSPFGVATEEFLIGRHEITNQEYLAFISAGGYRDTTYWPDSLLIRGKISSRPEALAGFVDRSGLPGPRTWVGGRYADQRGDHPVTGVSWYEAMAYAAWAGGSLPDRQQWWRGALGDSLVAFPWGQDGATAYRRANLEGVATTPVGSYPLGVSRFGVLDLAGNVREWLLDAVPGTNRRTAVGGSWQDPPYMFEASHAERFEPDYASEGVGFRIARKTGKR